MLMSDKVGSRAAAVLLQEHPHLMTPWHMLHPCETASIMSLLMAGPLSAEAASTGDLPDAAETHTARGQQPLAVAYMLAWMSVVGPLVGLHVPCNMSDAPAQQPTC